MLSKKKSFSPLLKTFLNQKAHSYQLWTLPQHITCIQKNYFKRHLESLIVTQRMTVRAWMFCMSLLFSRKWDEVSNVTNRIELVQHKSSLPASEATFTDVSLPCLLLIGHSSTGWLFSLCTCTEIGRGLLDTSARSTLNKSKGSQNTGCST